MEVAFTIAHDKPVTWHATFVLGSAEPKCGRNCETPRSLTNPYTAI